MSKTPILDALLERLSLQEAEEILAETDRSMYVEYTYLDPLELRRSLAWRVIARAEELVAQATQI